MLNRKLDLNKYDKYGQKLTPGNVCVRLVRDNMRSDVQFCIYIGETKGSSSSGKFGRFKTPTGRVSIKYTNVIFVFDPMTERRANTDEISKLMKGFYEEV